MVLGMRSTLVPAHDISVRRGGVVVISSGLLGIGWVRGDRRLGCDPAFAMFDQRCVSLRTHELGQLGPVGDVDPFTCAVRFGRRRAPPGEVVATRAPASAVVLADRDDQDFGVIRPLYPLECSADRQLPADVGLRLERMPVDRERETVQGAADPAVETGTVQEDAGAVDPFWYGVCRLRVREAFLALLIELPCFGVSCAANSRTRFSSARPE